MNRNTIILSAAVVLLVVATAAASTFVARESLTKPAAKPYAASKNELPWHGEQAAPAKPRPQQTASVQKPACDDGNVVGIVAGGLGGGLVGSQIGKGKGNTAATIGGAVGGAYLGGQYIPTRGVTCK